MTKNDEKTSRNDAYKAFLMAKLEEAKAGIDYYSKSKNGEWNHKKLASQWKKKKEEIQSKLNKERIDPEEFAADADWYAKRNAFGLY
jgi:hypothetical protein